MPDFDFEAAFDREFTAAIADEMAGHPEFPQDDWYVAGVRPRQDWAWWMEHGPGMARAYADWYESHKDVSVWIAPDGRPAIELDLTVQFGRIPIRMRIDQILKIGTALVVVDVKTGAKAPEDEHRQLATYACGVELAYGIRPKYGTYFMGKKGEFLPPVTLDAAHHSLAYLTTVYAELDEAVRRVGPVFPANPGPLCRTCGVNDSCAAVGGPLAYKHDPAHPDYRRGQSR